MKCLFCKNEAPEMKAEIILNNQYFFCDYSHYNSYFQKHKIESKPLNDISIIFAKSLRIYVIPKDPNKELSDPDSEPVVLVYAGIWKHDPMPSETGFYFIYNPETDKLTLAEDRYTKKFDKFLNEDGSINFLNNEEIVSKIKESLSV